MIYPQALHVPLLPCDGNQVECIALSDSDSLTSCETEDHCSAVDGEVLECTGTGTNSENQIPNEQGCSLDNRDVISSASLPAMPDAW